MRKTIHTIISILLPLAVFIVELSGIPLMACIGITHIIAAFCIFQNCGIERFSFWKNLFMSIYAFICIVLLVITPAPYSVLIAPSMSVLKTVIGFLALCDVIAQMYSRIQKLRY